MRAVITGAAGFIGAALCHRLVRAGHEVVGVDCLTGGSRGGPQLRRLDDLLDHRSFRLVYADLATAELVSVLASEDVVFHLAGEAGAAPSWGARFGAFARNNVVATQRLLDASAEVGAGRVICASSFSVYGVMRQVPTPETEVPHPASPDGVTKLAAEGLAELYRDQCGLSVASLRFVPVYGPRQTSAALIGRMVEAARSGRVLRLRGSLAVRRDLVHVEDAVTALVLAADTDWEGIANIGGGDPRTLDEVVRLVEEQLGPIRVQLEPARPGDLLHAIADLTTAQIHLGYHPQVPLTAGLGDLSTWALSGPARGRLVR